ncbi:MAG: DNA polymerase III subunit delta, partial [Eubacterium sp.]|nr:DNA polymerase III subunit delta [Eubacterium sp.]
MNQIEKDIKEGKFHRFYLLGGEEVYLIRVFRKALINKLSAGEGDMNFLMVSGNDADIEEIADFGMTMPFMGERRLIVVNDTGWFAGSNTLKSYEKKGINSDRLIELLGNLPETTHIVFTDRKLNKMNGRTAFFEGRLNTGIHKPKPSDMVCVFFDKMKGEELINWIAGYAAHSGKQITKNAAKLLVERAGNDMYSLSREMDKLIGYSGKRKGIVNSDIEAVVGGVITTKVYEMIDMAASSRSDEALRLYRDLVLNREDPAEIMYSLGMQFDTLYKMKQYEGSGLKTHEIAEKIKMNERIRWKAPGFMKMAK